MGKDNRIFYYQDEVQKLTTEHLKEISQEKAELQKVIEEAKINAPKPENFTVLIKPTDDANYKNFVDILDEMSITKTEKFGISEIKEKEEQLYQEKIK